MCALCAFCVFICTYEHVCARTDVRVSLFRCHIQYPSSFLPAAQREFMITGLQIPSEMESTQLACVEEMCTVGMQKLSSREAPVQ